MSLPVWPATLPSPTVGGATYTPQDNSIRTQMVAGAAKVRRRFTAVPEMVQFTIRLTSLAQVQTLDAFVATTLKDVLPFNWKNFRAPSLPVAVYRFVRRPTYTAVDGGYRMWDAQVELELLP